MKNNFVKAMIVVPLALSVSFGVAACGQVSTTSSPVSQENAIDAATLKANAVATVDSLKQILTSPENVKKFDEVNKSIKEDATGDEAYKALDPNGKIWSQITPFIDLPTNDKNLRDYVFGADKTQTASDAKIIVINNLLSNFSSFDGEIVSAHTDRYVFDYPSVEKTSEGRIIPKNQSMILKDNSGIITDVRNIEFSFKFSADGNKLSYDKEFIAEFEKASDLYMLNITLDAMVNELLARLTPTDETVSHKEFVQIANDLKSENEDILEIDYNEKTEDFKLTLTNKTNKELKVTYDSKNPEKNSKDLEDWMSMNLVFSVFSRIDPSTFSEDMKYYIDAEEEFVKSKGESAEKSELVNIYKSAKLSEDGKFMTAVIDGQEYAFAFSED